VNCTLPPLVVRLLSGAFFSALLLFLSLDAKAQLSVQLIPKTYAGGYNITCHGLSDGRIDALVTNGQAPYSYVWSPAVSFSASAMDLAAGNYTLIVVDNNGDTATASIELIEPNVIEAMAAIKLKRGGMAVTAHGDNDGETTLTVKGGTPPYSYLWNTIDGQIDPEMITKPELRSLRAGSYQLMVSGTNGCNTTASLTLAQPSALQLQLTPVLMRPVHHISCFKGNDGSIDLSVSGGVPPYEYMWSNGQFSEDASGLSAGEYEVRVIDANGARASATVELTQPDELSLHAEATVFPNGYHVSCHDCFNGSIHTIVTGGSEPYSYTWHSPSGIESQSAQLSNAGESAYKLIVHDAAGCEIGEYIELKLPDRDDWQMNGNTNLQANQFIGTTDSTDFVMKANNQPQLRLGADGVTELMQQFRLSAFNDLTAEPLRIPAMGPDGTFLTALDPDMIFDAVNPCKVNSNGLHIPRWVSGESKIFTDCNPVNVGIGTNNPLAKLDVRGQTYSQTLSVNTYAQDAKVTIKGGQPGTQNQFKALEVQDTGGEATLRVFNDGKVVIGKGTYANTGETPIFLIQNDGQQILKVNNDGLVWAREIKLSLDVFPDYVFKDGYNLMSIEDLHNFISTKGHLPNVPEEKDIVDNGMNVSELISVQMEKIEELTLYIIELNSRLRTMERELEKQNR